MNDKTTGGKTATKAEANATETEVKAAATPGTPEVREEPLPVQLNQVLEVLDPDFHPKLAVAGQSAPVEDDAPAVEPAKEDTSTRGRVTAGVEYFLANHLRNSSMSQDTEAWNHFHQGIPVLIEAIVTKLEG